MTTVRATSTPHFLLDAANGWRMAPGTSGIIEDPLSARLRLGKPGDFPIAANEPFGSFGGMTLPRGVTVAEEGRVLLADPTNNRILYYDSLSASVAAEDAEVPAPFKILWRRRKSPPAAQHGSHEIFARPDDIGPYDLLEPEDVLFSPLGEIIIADSGHGRVLVYGWPDMRLRQVVGIPGSRPVALAFDRRHRLHIADSANGKIWRLDRLWRLDHGYYGGDGKLGRPSALAFDRDDDLLILDSEHGRIMILSGKAEVSRLDTQGVSVFSRRFLIPPFRLQGDRLEYPQIRKPDCPPWRLEQIAVDRQGRLAGTTLPLLARPRIIRLPRNGVYYSEQLDSDISSSQWHRIVLQAEVPPTGRIIVQTHSGDRSLDDSEIDGLQWSEPAIISTDQGFDRPEVLIQSRRGRFLHIRVELLGDGHGSPAISNIQVYGPRQSSLRFLPPPFHQDPDGAFFLDRFLSYFDTVQDEIRHVMADFSRYLDPEGVPAGDFLDWLGSWFDWKFLAQWPTALRRQMIARSIELFKMRGTLDGLRLMLQWHTGLQGDQPQIIEHFRVRDYGSRQHAPAPGEDAPDLYIAEKPLHPAADEFSHWFTVVLPVSAVPDEASFQLVSRLIESQKPAHTAYRICLFRPGLRIGKQSSIGIDTWLGNYPGEPLGGMALGQSSGLAPATSSGHRLDHQILKSTWQKDKANG